MTSQPREGDPPGPGRAGGGLAECEEAVAVIGASHDLSPDRGRQPGALFLSRVSGVWPLEGRREGSRGKLTATNDPNHNGEVASDEAAPAPAFSAGTQHRIQTRT